MEKNKKELPKYFVIKSDLDNPLWQKYINWLNEKYNSTFEGNWEGMYYGYDGNKHSTHGTDWYRDIECFKNKPIILTLEEWDEIVNGFKLPERWCIKATPNTGKIIAEFFDRTLNIGCCYVKGLITFDYQTHYFYNYNLYSNVNMFNTTPGANHSSPNKIMGFTEITFDQFKKYVLKQNNMEDKKIIGYKFKNGYDKYQKIAMELADIIEFGKFQEGTLFEPNSYCEKNFKEAGVLDLWFEPVYEEEYKVGDWVVVKHSGKHCSGWHGWSGTRILQISYYREKEYYFPLRGKEREVVSNKYYIGFNYNTIVFSANDIDEINTYIVRKATPEEVKMGEIVIPFTIGSTTIKINLTKEVIDTGEHTYYKKEIEEVLQRIEEFNKEFSKGKYEVALTTINIGCEIIPVSKLKEILRMFYVYQQQK